MAKQISIEPKTRGGWGLVLLVSIWLAATGVWTLFDEQSLITTSIFYGVPGMLGLYKSITELNKLSKKDLSS